MTYHADDYGLNSPANNAIGSMIQAESLTSVSVIVTNDSFDDIKPNLETVKLPVFLHVNLTEGRPVSDPDKIRSLVNKHGEFVGQTGLFLRVLAGNVYPRDIFHELYAQLDKLKSAGVEVVGIDTHQHAHMFEPIAYSVYEFAHINKIKHVRSFGQLVTTGFWASVFKKVYMFMSIVSNDNGQRLPMSWREKRWVEFVMATWQDQAKYKGSATVVCHPGTNYDCAGNPLLHAVKHQLRVLKIIA
jgi:predicted glycoside hydrolase/deacetylase ChbG (UPF0249 family)